PDEEIQSAITRKVAGRDRRGTGRHFRQRPAVSYEPAVSPVDLETVLQQARARCERIAAARHIQVRETVPVGIEEQGSPIFVVLVGRPRLTLGGFDEAAVLPLDDQPAWDSCRTADEDIIQTVAVDVSHCQGRALSGERVREEGLYIVIDLRPGQVPVLQRPAGVDRLEWLMKQVGCSSLLNSVSLSQRHHSIDVQTREQLITPIGHVTSKLSTRVTRPTPKWARSSIVDMYP